MQEDFTWLVHYTDGTTLSEDDAGSFAGVDMGRVGAVELIPNQEGMPSVAVKIEPGSRPIFFRRRKQIVPLEDVSQVIEAWTVTVVGWQKTVRGVNVSSYLYFFSDGSVLASDRFDVV